MTDLMTDASVQAPQAPQSPITVVFIFLHGNRSEDLMQALVAWLGVAAGRKLSQVFYWLCLTFRQEQAR